MPSPLTSAFLPLLVLFPIYIILNLTVLGDYSWSWLLLSIACGTWFTYAVMQIFFGGFSGLDSKPVVVDMSKGEGQVI